MISPEQGDSTFIASFECQEKEECFNAISSPIDIIAHEDVIGVGRESAYFEQLEKIVELAMNVSADCDWAAHLHYIAFLFEDIFCKVAHLFDLTFLYLFSLLETCDDLVELLSV